MSHLKNWLSVSLSLGMVVGFSQAVIGQESSQDTEVEVYVPPAGTIYYWYDDNNGLHATDQLQTVPKKHRSAALKRAGVLPDGTDTSFGNGSQSQKSTAPSMVQPKGTTIEEPKMGEEYWREQLAEQVKIIEKSEREVTDVNAEIIRQNATHPPGYHAKIAELDARKNALEAAIKDAKFELEEGIPERARKAGAQPGWLR